MPSRNVENRDRGRREWVGGRFCPPLHVMEGGPYRPQITMWLELPEPLVVACHVEDPKEQTTFAQTLREAMRRPLAGPPRRPGRVRVADALQAAELRAAMPDLEVAVAPTPELELLGRDLAEHLLESTPEKDTESYLEGGRIPAPAVARLFEAARLLYASRGELSRTGALKACLPRAQDRRDGNGTLHQSLDRARPRWTALGDGERAPGSRLPVRASGGPVRYPSKRRSRLSLGRVEFGQAMPYS